MKYLFIVLLTFFLAVGFHSCSSDIDINAPWTDITVVYGLLNQNDSIHYIKVNKAFLGDASAYEMAAISDSVNYKNIDVYLYKINTSNGGHDTVKTYIFKDTVMDKESGTFATDNNIIYYNTEALITSSESNNIEDYTFALKIYIPQYDKNVTASTKLISKLLVSRPNSYQPTITLKGISDYSVEWTSTEGAKLYQLILGFHYYELTATDTTEHYLEYPTSTKISQTDLGGEDMKQTINGGTFFQYLASNIEANPNIKRIVKEECLDFIFFVGSTDLNTYIEVSSPSNGIVQEKPAYSNINGGIGIFSSRFNKSIAGKELDQRTIDSLAISPLTNGLNFENYANTLNFWATINVGN
ncbi:MAG TPA: hypothetical protein EYP69_01410 [Bacteroidales bacterium]|nr:hypothetical protein [Bacteroidales bacterium]